MFQANVKLRNPAGHTADGEMFILAESMGWQMIPYLEPDGCGHFSTICRECTNTWEEDHDVRLPSLI